MSARIVLLLIGLSCIPAPARAVSIEEIIELTQAGLPDAVLMALIDADQTRFVLDAKQVLALREAGVSETVLLKMIRSRREFEAGPAQNRTLSDGVPSLMIVGVATPPLRPAEVTTVVVPYYIPVPVRSSRLRDVGAAVLGAPTPHLVRRSAEREGGSRPSATAREPRGFGRFINGVWMGQAAIMH